MSLYEVETRVCGIPCIIMVTSWTPFVEATTDGPSHRWADAEGGYGDWDVHDRRGRYAPWLENKMSAKDREKINKMLFEHIEG